MKNDSYKKRLRANGYKLTPQRLKIISIFEKSLGEHLSAEDVYEIVKEKDSDMGLATVYRTIQLLEDLSILSSINIGDGKIRYELSLDDEEHNHHHMICNECGGLEEFKGDFLDELEKEVKEKHSFLVKNHELKFYGLCSKCQKNLNQKESKSKKI